MTMKELAYAAYRDLIRNWWEGDEKTGHFKMIDNGLPAQTQYMFWDHAQAIFALDTLYRACGLAEIHDRIAAEWAFCQRCFPYEMLVIPAGGPNWAQDDAGWDAMVYLTFYRHTRDPYALRAACDLIRHTYEHWQDGSLSNGLLYPHDKDDPNERNVMMHVASTMLAAFDYAQASGDDSLTADTVTLYTWTESHMLRNGNYSCVLDDGTVYEGHCDDLLYWMSYNKARIGKRVSTGPEYGLRPYVMEEADSAVFLGGVMGMAAVHMRMFAHTGDIRYRQRAYETLRAVFDCPYLVRNGVFVNAGDGFTNCAFMQEWVAEVMPLSPDKAKDAQIIKSTAVSIYQNARTADGYYSASWSGPAEDDADTPWGRMGWTHNKIMTCATSVHMIAAAALAESLGM